MKRKLNEMAELLGVVVVVVCRIAYIHYIFLEFVIAELFSKRHFVSLKDQNYENIFETIGRSLTVLTVLEIESIPSHLQQTTYHRH